MRQVRPEPEGPSLVIRKVVFLVRKVVISVVLLVIFQVVGKVVFLVRKVVRPVILVVFQVVLKVV